MEKRLRSSLHSSVEDFLSSAAAEISTKPGKSALKTLIWSITPSSSLPSSLPPALHLAVSRSVDSFKNSLRSDVPGPSRSSRSPPLKRPRRSSRHNNKSDDQDEILNPNSRPETLDLLKKLHAYAYIAHLCITHPREPFSPEDILPAVQSLHDSLVLYEMDPALLSQVASLCEEWWKEKLPGRETLISQSLPFLLSRSLEQSTKAGLHRVYALREAFSLLDYVDESIEDMRLLLVRCVITPLYLKTEEGRRFIAFMLGLNGQLAKEALALIRSQIPFGRKSVLEAYADILFRAWKCSEGSLRDEIEDGFLQGLIEGATHASSRSLAASTRRVLGGFINQRATDGVEKLLFRLAEPVLFRSLQVANSNVRQNALHLLLDMFPLEDPDVTKEAKDTLLDKQFFLLERLLVDDCPDVRVIAVEGSCRILHLFWEVIPSSTITKFLTKIIDNMSHDMCNEVRVSTVNGIIYLLENPQSHEILKVLLPRLGYLFLDPVLSVRVAIADLLLAVRDIRAFQFNKVVDLDALLSSLANDHTHVVQRITRLLIPSYFPSKLNLKEACGRCIALIKRSPTAGARFCEFALSEGSASKSLMELVRVSVSLSLSPKGLNPEQIDGLFVASANLCCSLFSEPSCKASLSELFSRERLKCLLTAAASARAQTAVLSIASILSPDSLVEFREQCMDLLMNCDGLSDNEERQAVVRAAHKLMFSCGWFDDLLRTLTNILQVTASGFLIKFGLEMPQQGVTSMKKKIVKLPMKSLGRLDHVNGKGLPNPGLSDIDRNYAVAAASAWQMKELLTSVETRNAVLKSSFSELAFSALRIISQASIEQCMHLEYMDMAPVLAYTAFAMYMSAQNIDSAVINNLGGEQNNRSKWTNSSPEPTILDQSLHHILDCAEKLFCEPVPGKSGSSITKRKHEREMTQHRKSKRKEALVGASSPTKGGELKANFPEAKRIQNVVKMVTSVLRFIVDAVTMGLVAHNQVRCLRFASAYVRYIISAIGTHQNKKSPFKDEDLKEMLAFLKCSFTYSAKLIHLVLTNCGEPSAPPLEAYYLANDLLDLITSIESFLGSKYASHIFSVAKPWLPDLILGLGSNHLVKATEDRGGSTIGDPGKPSFPVWLTVLGKVELCEVIENQDDQGTEVPESELSVFKKLMEVVVGLLKKGNPKILDAVGVVLITGLEVGLETADFGLVLGLLHFTCVKLVGKESVTWNELELMSNSLRDIYSCIDRNLTDPSVNEDGRHKLESAKVLLGSVCVDHE